MVEDAQREFEARLGEHRGIVFKIANTYCPDREERDDLAQEICLQLWRAYPGYDHERRFSTWMYRVALNTAISFARTVRVRKRRVVPLDEPGADATAEAPSPPEQDERIARLYRSLHGLAALDRALVVLYLEDRTYREIAEVLGISETNVGTKLARLKQMFRRDVAQDMETEHGTR
jgi:RNA polymerase sigma factor (sigma-70 family)